MKKQSNSILLRKEYEQWIQHNGVSTASQASYFPQDKYPNTKYTYFEVIANFLIRGDITFAYTILDEWIEKINASSASNSNAISPKSISNKKSYLSKIYEFFLKESSKYLPQKGELQFEPTISDVELNDFRKKYNKSNLAQIDGMDTLLNAIGVKQFIKLAIESSFFFHPDIVKDRFNEMAHSVENKGELPARNWKEDKIDPNGLKVIKDGNGNSKVCQIIKHATGYNLNATLDIKPFINNIISHVWGNATDPLFFSAFWNIVLIPAWANHLMDKPIMGDTSLQTKLQTTFRAICLELYDMKNLPWENMKIKCPDVEVPKAVQHGNYNIRVIKPGPTNKAGLIEIYDIKI